MERVIPLKKTVYLVIGALLAGLLPTNIAPVHAGVVSSASDVLSTIKESIVANHTITFTLNGSDTFSSTENITVTFPTGFNLASLSSPNDFDFRNAATDESVQTGACGATDTIRAVVSSQVVTFTACNSYTAEAAGSTIIIKIGTHASIGATGTNQITNQTAAQNNSDPKILIGGTEATGSIAVEIVADNDVTVNATVDPSITCSFTGLTTTFASLTTGAISTSDTNTAITLSTNAGSGLNVTVYDAGNATNPGLYKSTATTYLIGSADGSYGNTITLAAGTDGYGLTAAASGGSGATLTVDGRFDASGGANEVGGLEVGAGAAVSIAAATGAVASRVLTITHKAAVSGLAPAGSYTDTITYVCSGIF